MNSDIIPPRDTKENTDDILWKMKFYSSPRVFYMTTRYGEIRHPTAFYEIFGDTS